MLSKRFSLIELLVVMAILALLASVLSPALKKTLESARIASCKQNLKQIVTSAQVWAGDNDDYTVPAAWWIDHEYNNRVFQGSLQPYTGASIREDNSMYSCPSITEEDLKSTWRKTDVVDNIWYQRPKNSLSYGVNGYGTTYSWASPGDLGIKDDRAGSWGPGWAYWSKHGVTRLEKIRYPSRFMYFMDHDFYTVFGWNFNPKIDPDQLNYSTRWHPPFNGLYGNSNMAFYDGSVGSEPEDLGSDWTYYAFKDNK